MRSIAFATADLDGLHRVAATICGATVNDAVLTVVSGGLRRWLEATHCTTGPVRVKVPVSLHGAEPRDHGTEELGNRDSYFCLDLPLGPEDPAVRLETIHQATRARKGDHDAEWLDAVMRELGKTSPGLRRFADHVLSSPRSFALNVSNVPGPRRPIDVLGVPVDGDVRDRRDRPASRAADRGPVAGRHAAVRAVRRPGAAPGRRALALAIQEEAAELAAIPAAT